MSAGFSSITESTDKSDTIAETSREVKSTQLMLKSLVALTNEQLVETVSFISGSILPDSCDEKQNIAANAFTISRKTFIIKTHTLSSDKASTESDEV